MYYLVFHIQTIYEAIGPFEFEPLPPDGISRVLKEAKAENGDLYYGFLYYYFA